MVGLKISMPSTCIDCPCLHTMLVDGMAVRFCMAEHKELIVIPKKDTKDSVKWMDLPRPEWCSLVELA